MQINNDRLVLKELLELFNSLCEDGDLATKLDRPEREAVESLIKAVRLMILFYGKRINDGTLEPLTH
jgi:hypothetical protein